MFTSTVILGILLAGYLVARFLTITTIGEALRVSGSVKMGTASNPPDIDGGTGVMSLTNKPNGSLWLRSDADTLPEVGHNSAVAKLGLSGSAIECRLGTLTANVANEYITYVPRDLIITGVRRRYTTVPASAGGNVVVGITAAGNQILASSSETEEGMTNDTIASHNLTGTTANLKVSSGAKIVLTITSNNADMTGGTNCQYQILYDDN